MRGTGKREETPQSLTTHLQPSQDPTSSRLATQDALCSFCVGTATLAKRGAELDGSLSPSPPHPAAKRHLCHELGGKGGALLHGEQQRRARELQARPLAPRIA